MNIAVLTFDGFNELDSFIAAGILNRMKEFGWNVQITCPSEYVTSMNGVTIRAQQPLDFANKADAVLFGSGIFTRKIAQDDQLLSQLSLNSQRQLIGGQCSGTLLMSVLGLLDKVPACTDLTTKPWVIESGVKVLEQPFYAQGNIATAGGCLSSKYLATWVLCKLAGLGHAEVALHYVAPVGEKESTIKHCMSIVGGYL
ncbi:DJ-1/PfpI family protein [Vibrio metoecus]|uniref:AraC family transcriptional regulator n=1 Tax=Vibrio metoecus TaxID=1481663 RepID=A0A271VIG5_VIBMT|nr:DJ-1/PfpI family protein [Vibrio metoecus]EIV8469543.1 DJ-1/PfpI family protein [Vibrio vulnificus]KQA16289.1 AraC family transcriptional regulator [Vibrio metoecus]KQB07060.1 AraC family transcriptional regulator [Vibrio metoecus]PAR17958.1 AraC family transcriptional regulator [Vibrio metoecus]PAR21429.1 AraC family transcriptional regulator [Vibrio metoecus]